MPSRGKGWENKIQENSTNTDFHCLLNNTAATYSCSSTAGKSFTRNTVSPPLQLLLSYCHGQLQQTHSSTQYTPHLSASKVQICTIGEAIIVHSHSYSRCRTGLIFSKQLQFLTSVTAYTQHIKDLCNIPRESAARNTIHLSLLHTQRKPSLNNKPHRETKDYKDNYKAILNKLIKSFIQPTFLLHMLCPLISSSVIFSSTFSLSFPEGNEVCKQEVH